MSNCLLDRKREEKGKNDKSMAEKTCRRRLCDMTSRLPDVTVQSLDEIDISISLPLFFFCILLSLQKKKDSLLLVLLCWIGEKSAIRYYPRLETSSRNASMKVVQPSAASSYFVPSRYSSDWMVSSTSISTGPLTVNKQDVILHCHDQLYLFCLAHQ